MSPDLISIVTSASMALITFLSGCLIAATPWLTRGREAFAVSVPETAQADPRIRSMRRAYLACILIISAASALVTLAFSSTHPLAMAAVVCAPVAAGFLLMLAFRARVRAIKRSEGWGAHSARLSAVAGAAEANAPRPLPLAWNLLYLPVILATLALSLALYPAMPDPVPVHFNAAGAVDDYMAKGWQVIAMPIAVQAFMALCLTASHWQILRSRRPSSPEHPVASAIAYGMFARAQSATLLVTGIVITVSIAIMPLAFAGVVTSDQSFVAFIAIIVAAILPNLAVSLVYGQAGSRLLRRMTASSELGFDDDESWHLGLFYINREDPSVVVPRRFGIGWTMNWGNPKSWGLAALLVAAIVVFVVLIEVLFR